jgi:predicted RNase H-like nuclease
VFSIPVRAAVEAEDYRAACAQALAGSNPPRKVAKQGFFLFPKIREIDALLRRHAGLAEALVETHPELVFRRLKGVPLTFAKKTPEGLVERRALLRDAGIAEEALMQAPPRGAGTDDLLDALACLLTAARLARGKACPHPDPFERDRYGNPIAIWA